MSAQKMKEIGNEIIFVEEKKRLKKKSLGIEERTVKTKTRAH